MTRVLHRLRTDEVLIPCATAQPAERPRGIDAPRPARQAGVAVEVLRDLRAADTTPAALGMRRPTAPVSRPLPTHALIERLTAVSTAMHADYDRHLDTLAVLDGIAAAIADGADAHVVRMALAPIAAELAALAPVATLKAQVAL